LVTDRLLGDRLVAVDWLRLMGDRLVADDRLRLMGDRLVAVDWLRLMCDRLVAVDWLRLRLMGHRLVANDRLRLLGDRLVAVDLLRLLGDRLVVVDWLRLRLRLMVMGWVCTLGGLGGHMLVVSIKGGAGVQNLNQELDQILKFNLVSNRGDFGCGCCCSSRFVVNSPRLEVAGWLMVIGGFHFVQNFDEQLGQIFESIIIAIIMVIIG